MKIKKYLLITAVLLSIIAAGCGNSKAGDYVIGQRYYNPSKDTEKTDTESVAGTESVEDTQAEEGTIGTDLFLITDNDMRAECLILEQLASGKQYMYYYSVTTRFLDKYGNRTTASYFEPGRVVEIGKKDIQGRLLEASISDAVWEYPDITRYSVDEERGVFQIADTNYSYGENLFVHSDGKEEQLSDLTSLDTIRVIGIGKQILSVSVTTGHGELQLSNTDLFEGSFIQIGSKIFSEVTKDMCMELPEGDYLVAVANNGYGGSTEIAIERGKTTVLDLDTIKGDGPKYGSILFAVDVEGATVAIDGKPVDYSEPVEVQYGVHSLQVSADSYDTYSKKLFVNSEKATIVIGLSGESTDFSTSANGETTTDSEAASDAGEKNEDDKTTDAEGSLAGSLAGSRSAGTGTTTSGSSNSAVDQAELDAIVDSLLDEDGDSSSSDYVSTIKDVLKSLSGSDE